MSLIYHTPLSAAQQAVAGIEPVQPLALADRVRFSELDVMNHVNNTVYMEWFERLRIRYCLDWGVTDYRRREQPSRVVIRSGTIHYRQEMLADEDYIVTCGCTAFRTSSYSLAQQLWSGGTLRATFDCVLVHLEPDGSARQPLSDTLKARFATVDEATAEG